MATDPGTRKLEETWRPRLPKRSGGSSRDLASEASESRAKGEDISKEGLRAAEERDHREGGRDPPLRGCNFSRNLEKIIKSCSYLDLVITFTFLQQ